MEGVSSEPLLTADLTGSGLSTRSQLVIFAREGVRNLWNALQALRRASPGSRLLVQGPPGTGKSSIAWVWGCHTPGIVLWVHINRTEVEMHVCLLDNGKPAASRWWVAPFKSEHLSALARIRADVLILDSVTNINRELALGFAADFKLAVSPPRSTVVVTSAQLRVHPHEMFHTTQWEMPSWTFPEYTAACGHTKFVNHVRQFLEPTPSQPALEPVQDPQGRVEQLLGPAAPAPVPPKQLTVWLQEKFFLAGGSARWMFGTTVGELPGIIDNLLRFVEDAEGLANANSRDLAESTVGHLVMRRDGNQYLVSHYVERRVALMNEHSFLRAASNLNIRYNNPAFDGWLLEFEFLSAVSSASRGTRLLTLSNQGKDFSLPVSSVQHVEWDGTVKNPQLTGGTWLVPKRWNQGGYDAAFIHNGGVHFVQVTRAESHPLKVNYMKDLLDALGRLAGGPAWTVAVAVVTPSGKTFRQGKVTGTLEPYKRWTGTSVTHPWQAQHAEHWWFERLGTAFGSSSSGGSSSSSGNSSSNSSSSSSSNSSSSSSSSSARSSSSGGGGGGGEGSSSGAPERKKSKQTKRNQ